MGMPGYSSLGVGFALRLMEARAIKKGRAKQPLSGVDFSTVHLLHLK
jgi:hypothetical protein